MVYRSFVYKLTPTKTQERALSAWLALGAELYNAALQERRDAWRTNRIRVARRSQERALAEIRTLRPEYAEIPVAVLRGWLDRLDKAFTAFFLRCKRGDKPGYPRFRAARHFDTIEVNDVGRSSVVVAGGKRVAVPLLGKVRVKLHRPLRGKPKSYRITRKSTGWWISIQCENVPVEALPATGLDVGVDVGLATLAATSDSELFENPRALARAENELARAQRRVSRCEKGSSRRRKAIKILARKHERVANVRRESAIMIARSLVARYDTIYVEDLNIRGLASGMLAKSVHDASWGILRHWIGVKAEEAARQVCAVDPRGTSIECSNCGRDVPKDLSVRVHRCPYCGYVVDRDVNAARNVKARGRRARGGTAGPPLPAIREESTKSPAGWNSN